MKEALLAAHLRPRGTPTRHPFHSPSFNSTDSSDAGIKAKFSPLRHPVSRKTQQFRFPCNYQPFQAEQPLCPAFS
jgi:hypothetical protein